MSNNDLTDKAPKTFTRIYNKLITADTTDISDDMPDFTDYNEFHFQFYYGGAKIASTFVNKSQLYNTVCITSVNGGEWSYMNFDITGKKILFNMEDQAEKQRGYTNEYFYCMIFAR